MGGKRGPEFTPEEVERALTALALVGGNSVRAHEMLEQDPELTRAPSQAVLREWRLGPYAERFRELLNQRAPEIEAAAVHDYRQIVARTNEIHLQGLERTAAGIDELDAKDASAAVKNLAIAGGVAADKLLVFTDRPNVIHSRPNPEDTLRQLASTFGITIDSTAEEIPSAELAP